jgi:spermidine dehydrogenase
VGHTAVTKETDMDAKDRSLGMGRQITRRDFVNGVSVATAGSLLVPKWAMANGAPQTAPGQAPGFYPPAATGMRGSHDGSFEGFHLLRDAQQQGKPSVDLTAAAHTGETYDLVVVGAGMSGLAAAYYFLKNAGRNTKVLVLDNHDDFGGHAKRNEYVVDGKLIVVNGGTLNIEAYNRYDEPSKVMLREIGLDLDRYIAANAKNRQLYASFGLGSGLFFDKETWGTDRLVVRPPAQGGGRGGGGYTAEFLAKTPLSAKAQKDMLALNAQPQPDYMPGMSSAEKKARLARMSYSDYLTTVVKADPQVLWFYQHYGEGNFCVGADANPALFAWNMGQPGFSGLNLEPMPHGIFQSLQGTMHGRQTTGSEGPVPSGPTVHFPDGNATVARSLVRWLIPDAIPGKTQEDLGTARVNYAALDRPNQGVRIRLNSTAVNVRHDGDPSSAKEVVISYSRDGKIYDVRSRGCVLACWHSVIPYMVPELPANQKAAMLDQVKGPIVYTSIAIRNWRAFQKLGVASINASSMYHPSWSLTEAATLGDLVHAQTPDEPIALHLTKAYTHPGQPKREQHRLGRTELLNTTFETFERTLRDHLARMMGPGGFDPARDIAGITVNRWPHGYAYTYNSLCDPMEWVYTSSDERPNVTARRTYGLIAMANADAGATPHTDTSFWEAHRAVNEVLERREMPLLAPPSGGTTGSR